MRSTSSLVKEFLLTRTDTAPLTAEQILQRIQEGREAIDAEPAHLTLGGVSGFLHKAREAQAVAAANVDGLYHYNVIDKQALADMRIKEGSSGGSKAGRTVTRKTHLLPTTQSIQARLLDLAAELELARSPLATYSTAELLAEIERRTK